MAECRVWQCGKGCREHRLSISREDDLKLLGTESSRHRQIHTFPKGCAQVFVGVVADNNCQKTLTRS